MKVQIPFRVWILEPKAVLFGYSDPLGLGSRVTIWCFRPRGLEDFKVRAYMWLLGVLHSILSREPEYNWPYWAFAEGHNPGQVKLSKL